MKTQAALTATSDLFAPVRAMVEQVVLAAWDGCHKIYLALDEVQAEWYRENYNEDGEHLIEGTPEAILFTVAHWWDQSCELRFVTATKSEWLHTEYTSVIDQGAADEIPEWGKQWWE